MIEKRFSYSVVDEGTSLVDLPGNRSDGPFRGFEHQRPGHVIQTQPHRDAKWKRMKMSNCQEPTPKAFRICNRADSE